MPSFSKILILSALLVSLSGCFKADKKSQADIDKNSGSSFIVGEVTGRSDILPEDLDPVSKYPKARTYTFSACVKNWVTDAKLYGQKFVATDGNREFPTTLTDSDKGCFSWQEKVAYNPTADAVYVELVRSIKGSGVNRGQVDIPIAVMPWVQDRKLSELEVRDLRGGYKPVPAGTEVKRGELAIRNALGGVGQEFNGYVWVEKLVTENVGSVDAAGGGIIANITLEPKIKYKDAQGVIRYLPLADGKFRVEAKYISAQTVNGKEHRRLIATETNDPKNFEASTMQDGVLRARLHMHVPQQCTFGELELAIRVTPVGMIHGVKPFEGVFLVGECDRLMGTATARVRPFVREIVSKEVVDKNHKKTLVEVDKQFNLQAWEEANVRELKDHHVYDGYKKVNQFEFSSVALRFLAVEDETVTERTIQFRSSTCVSDPITRKPIEGLNFKISRVEDDGTLVPLTQERQYNDASPGGDRTQKRDACLNWVDSLRHKYYVPERYFKRTIEIEHIRSGNKHRVTLAINPWDYGFTFGHDVSDLGEKYFDQMNNKVKPKSYMILYNFRYETVRFRYVIDEFMTLKVVKSVLLRIDPRVIRYSSIPSGQERNEPLRDGYYLMKTAFQKDYLDTEGRKIEYINATKTLVLIRSGVLVTLIDLEISDLRLMRLRSNFLIELEPIDERRLGISASHTENFQKVVKDTVNYDDYRLNSEESGLPARTFVGPIIALSNYFGAGMRPTDELQEVLCKTANCNQLNLDESLPEHEKDKDLAKYYGKVSHLENVSVSDLIKRQDEVIKPHYLARMKRLSSLGNFVNNLNLEYLQLNDSDHLAGRFEDDEINKINKVIPSQKMPEHFLADINANNIYASKNGVTVVQTPNSPPLPGKYMAVPPVGAEDMMNLINTNTMAKPKQYTPFLHSGVDKSLRIRMCNYWFNKFLPKSVGLTRAELFDESSFITSNIDNLVTRCIVDGGHNATDEVFDATQMIRVIKLQNYDFKRGMSLNMQVGADFKLNHTEDYKKSVSASFKPLNALSNLFRDFVGTDFNIQWSKGVNESHSEGRSLNDGTNLVVQIAKFNIRISEYERCAYIKMKPSFLKSISFFEKIAAGKNNLSYEDAIHLASRGLLICSGEPIVNKPIEVRENYYYITQMFNDGDMLDLGDQKNHPWLLALRGNADYLRFVKIMQDMNVLDKVQVGRAIFNEADENALGGYVTGGVASEELQEKFKVETKAKMEDLWRHYGPVLGFDPVKHMQWKTAQPNKKTVDEGFDVEQERKFRANEYRELNGMKGPRSFLEQDFTKHSVADMSIKKGYEMGDFPVRHTADVYRSTLPTFPGFIVITEDSLRTKEAY